MNIKKIIKLFENGNVCVQGKKGRGKDMLMSNVAIRRAKKFPYISNINYGGRWIKFNPNQIDIYNNYLNFLQNNLNGYVYPYPDKTDIYISDAGIYFPSQYNGNLNNRFANFPMFFALSRHLGNCNVHINAQALNRVWDKIREQSDTYITTLGCKVIFKKIVIQKIRIHEKYESCLENCPPFRMRAPLLNKDRIQNVNIERERYYCTHGKIKDRILIYWNKSKYDTRFFGTMLREQGYNPKPIEKE